MALAFYSHPLGLLHDPGAGHPEAPARLSAILERVTPFDWLERQVPAAAPAEVLLRCHSAAYLASLEQCHARGGGALDGDTVMNAASLGAARNGAGAVLAAIARGMTGGSHAFCATRPPGHHALPDAAMGFCLFGTVAIGAFAALDGGAERVLIVDWDVHHGNGTQALVEHEPRIRFVSLHQWPWWPGSGSADERGVGNIFNVPRPAGLPAERYVSDLWDGIVTAAEHWIPDVVLISAGFDAMAGDPLGGFTLEPADYAELTTRLRTAFPRAPIVSALEGGYIPHRLADGVVAHLMALR